MSKAVPFFLGVEILGVSATLTLGSDPPTSKAVPIFSKLRTRQRAAVGCPVPANGQWAVLQFLKHAHQATSGQPRARLRAFMYFRGRVRVSVYDEQ